MRWCDPCRTPSCYGEAMRRRLRAGAQGEDLRSAGPFYYDVAEGLVQVPC